MPVFTAQASETVDMLKVGTCEHPALARRPKMEAPDAA